MSNGYVIYDKSPLNGRYPAGTYSIVTVDSLDMDLSTEPVRHHRTGTSKNQHAKVRKLKEY